MATEMFTTSASDLFSQAVQSFENALKTGTKLQQETYKWWTDVLGEPKKSTDWEGTMRTFVQEIAPITRKNAEESLKTIDTVSKNSLELLKKAFEGAPVPSGEFEKRIEKLWEDTFSALRKNTEVLLETNERAFQFWNASVEEAKKTATAATKAKAAN